MTGIRHWIGSTMLLLAPTVTFAQGFGTAPNPLPLPGGEAIGVGEAPTLGGGTIVSRPGVGVSVLPVARNAEPGPMVMPGPKAVPPTMPPLTTTNQPIPGVITTTPIPATTIPGVEGMPVPSSNTSLLTDGWQMMLGRNGPVSEDLYFRMGINIPFGGSALGKNLDTGINATLGGRSLFFNPEGSAAWVIDAHLSYTYNNASGQDTVFFRDEACTIRALTRWGVGLGLGRDWFSNNPGFVMGQFDMNFSWGANAGVRWGSGHVDLNPRSEINGYRRHHDVYGQSFVGGHANVEVPMGGWTLLIGGRAEWNYTFSDILPTNGSVHGVDLLATFGVRY